jgi:starvation-inducible DNA-binding protein
MEKLIAALKIVLGTSFNLYLKTHAAHWNVEGISFPALHTMFGEMYLEVWRAIDGLAEQVRQLDAYAPASMERLLELSRIKSSNDMLLPADMLAMLVKDHETLLVALTETLHLAEQADKQGLVNFLAARIEAHSKHRWQLRATAKRI